MTVTIKTTDISSNQEWTSDPTMVEIIFNANFYQMALKWIAIMQEENISYLCRYSMADFKLYDLEDDEPETTPRVIHEDFAYVEFTPEYTIKSCDIKVFKDGEIHAVLEMANSSSEVLCVLGCLDDMKSLFNVPV